ncbi:MAG TPA: GNAT family N-acetyltransferase [Micromonosporaceae bacterium]|jgi:ribosomal protein S18 acetylase RimI-like enzyme
MSKPRIRPFEMSDMDAVVHLALLAWRPNFESFAVILGERIFDHLYHPTWRDSQAASVTQACLGAGVDTFVVVADGGDVAGYVAIAYDTDTGTGTGVVEQIAVHPDHQRRGYARALMEFAKDEFRSRGLTVANVGTGGDPGHAAARALYEATGFTGLPLMNYYMAIE